MTLMRRGSRMVAALSSALQLLSMMVIGVNIAESFVPQSTGIFKIKQQTLLKTSHTTNAAATRSTALYKNNLPTTTISSTKWGVVRHRNHQKMTTFSRSSSALEAITSPDVISAIGHLVGGNLATPFVIKAVNTWYARIPLPSWCPPNGIFAPVWVTLYSMIGIAASRVATIKGWKSPTMLLWAAHYLLNLVWAPLFFGMAKLRAACIVNVILVASMIPIIYSFYLVDPIAAWLLLPYTAWITFATILNAAICKLNPMDGKGYSNAMLEAQIANLQKDAAKKAGL